MIAEYAYMLNSGVIGITDKLLSKYKITEEGYSMMFYPGDMAHVENCIM